MSPCTRIHHQTHSTIAIGQNDCRTIRLILDDIVEGNYFKNSKTNTGFSTNTGIEYDPQFLLYEELDTCASFNTMTTLLHHESNIVVAYAWKSILRQSPTYALNFYIDHYDVLEKRTFAEFLNKTF